MPINLSPDQDPQKRLYAGVFDRSSTSYDQVGPGYFAHFGRRLVEYAQFTPGIRLLDVACGRGATLFPAAEAVGPFGEVIGVDLAAGMVAETGREIAARSIPNAQVMQMDAEHLQFPGQSFDGVLCGFALFFFPHRSQALAEYHRVLKPGGLLAISTWGSNWDTRWEWLDKLVDAYIPPEPKQDAGQKPAFDLRTPAGMEAILTAAGFHFLRAKAESEEFAFRTEEDWWATTWSHGGRREMEEIERLHGPSGLERFKSESFAHLQTFKTPNGIPLKMEVVYTLGERRE